MIRAFRFVNVALGVWLLIAPWALVGASTAALWSDMIAGLALLILTLRLGTVRERYGEWDACLV